MLCEHLLFCSSGITDVEYWKKPVKFELRQTCQVSSLSCLLYTREVAATCYDTLCVYMLQLRRDSKCLRYHRHCFVDFYAFLTLERQMVSATYRADIEPGRTCSETLLSTFFQTNIH